MLYPAHSWTAMNVVWKQSSHDQLITKTVGGKLIADQSILEQGTDKQLEEMMKHIVIEIFIKVQITDTLAHSSLCLL